MDQGIMHVTDDSAILHEVRTKLRDEEVWLQAYCATLKSNKQFMVDLVKSNMDAGDVADECLKKFRERFRVDQSSAVGVSSSGDDGGKH